MRRAAKIDRNQPEIVAALLAVGCSVDVLPGGNGRPDLLVGIAGTNALLEVKDGSLPPSERRLNALQKNWHANWKGKAHVVETIEQALEIVAFYRGRLTRRATR